ncbi:MAG: hypothetical protein HOV70_11115 [Streptomyces sp.]|nr:hypothetical protein [Streptomyces sp.]
MSARDVVRSDMDAVITDETAERHLDAYRAEVLAEAADKIAGVDFHPNASANCSYLAEGFARRLRALSAEPVDPSKAARMQDAAETLAAARRTPARPPLSSRLALLLAHVQEHGGEWTTRRVQKLYAAEETPAPLRTTARKDLHALHAMGWLVLDTTDPGRRCYRLNHAHGGTR